MVKSDGLHQFVIGGASLFASLGKEATSGAEACQAEDGVFEKFFAVHIDVFNAETKVASLCFSRHGQIRQVVVKIRDDGLLGLGTPCFTTDVHKEK